MDNQYGLDYNYFERWLERILNNGGLKNYRPHECAREFARMSRAADESVLLEPEFTSELRGRLEKAEAERDALRAELNELEKKQSQDYAVLPHLELLRKSLTLAHNFINSHPTPDANESSEQLYAYYREVTLAALKYHQKQTRPITRTEEIIAKCESKTLCGILAKTSAY